MTITGNFSDNAARFKTIRNIGIAIVVLILVVVLNPFNTVPTGYRGVVTQFGAIKGIENEGQAELMRYLDCDRGQGFLFSRPLEAAGLASWANAHAERAESDTV